MPSTPASEANDAEDDVFEATMDLDEALNILPPLRPHLARIELNARTLAAVNRGFYV